jgi:LasA protease
MFQRASIRRLICFLVVAFGIPALACNYPSASPRLVQNGLPAAALRQTLQAQPYSGGVDLTPEGEFGDGIQPTPFVPVNSPTLTSETASAPGGGQSGRTGSDFDYLAHSGDTLGVLVERFQVKPGQITSSQVIPLEGFIQPGQPLNIPNMIEDTPYPQSLLPDSEVIYSPSSIDFDISTYVNAAGGYLSEYEEDVDGKPMTGADIVRRVALEYSINPQLLLAILEYRAGWVSGAPDNYEEQVYPIGFEVPGAPGLYKELLFTAKFLNIGYYGWRWGSLSSLTFREGRTVPINPTLNAGTVGLQYLFSRLDREDRFREELLGADGILPLYGQMFGEPWTRSTAVEPLLTPTLVQPALELPFAPGERWSFTGGPHKSWDTGSPRGALDFAPVTGEAACAVSRAWVTASASGVVTRSGNGVAAIDLDGDGFEGTGWVLVYMHLASRDRVQLGEQVQVNQPVGHPSCEGGNTTGTHVHMARKYDGEWMLADGPIPFVMNGWEVEMGEKSYQGYLVKGDQVVTANPGGSGSSIIIRAAN